MNNNYYKENFSNFIENTINADMSNLYGFFEKHLDENAKILDVGFGSGRDTIYFLKKYNVVSIDPVAEFVTHLKRIVTSEVYQLSVTDMDYYNEFDAIWACASLLHLTSTELPLALEKCYLALKPKGIFYLSFKHGEFEGIRNGRFFNDMTLNTFNEIIDKSKFVIIDTMITRDVRPDRTDEWLNLIVKKIV